MDDRFEDVGGDVLQLAREIQEGYFPENEDLNIKYLFDLKERISDGRHVLGRCQRTNDVIRHFTKGEVKDLSGIIYLDKLAYLNMSQEDRIRLIRHEQRHILYDPESTHPYKIAPHNIEDFIEEIDINKQDFSWLSKNAVIAEALYYQAKEEQKKKGKGEQLPLRKLSIRKMED